MAKYRIRVKSLNDYSKKPWYYLEKKKFFWWNYLQSSSDKDFLIQYIEAVSTPPEYHTDA